MSKQQKLSNILSSISNKRYFAFFFKLLIFDRPAHEGEQRVRNYDIECQAAETVASILNIKVKALYLRFLHLLGQTSKQKIYFPFNDITHTQKTISSQLQDIVPSTSALQQKVKHPNHISTNQQDIKQTKGNIQRVEKLQKRKQILIKIWQLENKLQQLSSERKQNPGLIMTKSYTSRTRLQYPSRVQPGSPKILQERYAIRW